MTTHLAETSVLTRLSVAAVRGALQPFIDAVALARCTLTDLELGFSASSASDWDRLQAVLMTLTSVEVTPVVISRAKNVQRMLAADIHMDMVGGDPFKNKSILHVTATPWSLRLARARARSRSSSNMARFGSPVSLSW